MLFQDVVPSRARIEKKRRGKNNKSKAVCDDVNNFGSSVAEKII